MIRVLLIDDEEDALDLMEILLGQIGGVEVAGRYVNPILAIEELSRLSVDAVFLDNQMPGVKGMEAARMIREKLPQIPIVFTTAYAEYAVEAFEIQSTDYLLKPFTKERLQNAVIRVKQALTAASPETRWNAGVSYAIQCLGGFHIQSPESGSRKLSWKTKKEKELCAYLIHHKGNAVSSASIIEALWPGYDLNKAKTYLYTCMSYLRKSLTDYRLPIHVQKADQGFAAVYDELAVDVETFERLVHRVLVEEETDKRLYDQMNSMYRGEYMEACDFGWASARQAEIRASYLRSLRKWYICFADQGNLQLAGESLQRVLALAPDSEADGRELIKLHLQAGNRNEALRVFMQLEQAVRLQLGADLEDSTMRLVRGIT